MKVTNIIGKKVLDNSAYEVGKISDIDIDIKNDSIEKIYINSNEISLRKANFEVEQEMVQEIGDYVLLNVEKKEIIKEKISKDVPDVEVVNPKELEDETSD